MWDISPPLADVLFAWSNVVLIVGAAAVLIGTIGSIKIGAIREHFADLRISDNERETSKANVRAAELEKEAAEARLEQERLKARLAWRTLSPDVVARLTSFLLAHPSKVNIEFAASDTEAQYLAIQLANIFSDAKWEVGFLQVTYAGTILFGILVPDSPYEGTALIRQALTAAQIEFATNALPTNSMGYGGRVPDGGTLAIGSKPIPQ
jgi:hypothetical protein